MKVLKRVLSATLVLALTASLLVSSGTYSPAIPTSWAPAALDHQSQTGGEHAAAANTANQPLAMELNEAMETGEVMVDSAADLASQLAVLSGISEEEAAQLISTNAESAAPSQAAGSPSADSLTTGAATTGSATTGEGPEGTDGQDSTDIPSYQVDRDLAYYQGEETSVYAAASASLPAYISTGDIRHAILDDPIYLRSAGTDVSDFPITTLSQSPGTEEDTPNEILIGVEEAPYTAPAGISFPEDLKPQISLKGVQQSSLEESKSYPESPYGYSYRDHESVDLNTGTMTYTYTDFTIPGRNGLDITVTRRYDSGSSNPLDPTIVSSEGTYYYYVYGVYHCRPMSFTYYGVTYYWNEYDKIDDGYGGPYGQASRRDEKMEEEQKRLEDHYLPKGYEVYIEPQSQGGQVYTTGTRKNTHGNNVFGLGYGWSFNFPSIETVEDTSETEAKTHDFLHLEDSRIYQTDATNATSGLKD